MKVSVEFDEERLGPAWLNPANLDTLLYTEATAHRDSLKVNKFKKLKE